MVSSYLICDRCGQFGPPASFLSQDGQWLCYPCWYQERCGEIPLESEPAPESESEASPVKSALGGWRSGIKRKS